MSLGRLGAMCGCSTGQECTDCQARTPGMGVYVPKMPGLAARWGYPTNYDPTLHRRYNVGVPGQSGFGEIQLGTTGWTLGDAASAALIVLAFIAIRKEWK